MNDAASHIRSGRGGVQYVQGRKCWVKEPGESRGRTKGPHAVNEVLFARIARSVSPEFPAAFFLPDGRVALEYREGLTRMVDSGVVLPTIKRVILATVDAALLNSDRFCFHVMHGPGGWTFLDHDWSLLGNGESDLNRFTRPVEGHPHGDYIPDRTLYPDANWTGRIVLATMCLRKVRDAWPNAARVTKYDTLHRGWTTERHWECLDRLPLWWDELERRIKDGRFFDPNSWQHRCHVCRRQEKDDGAPKGI